MAAVEIFSNCVSYKYKNKICSLSSFVVLFLLMLSFFTPFFIISNAGGFSLMNRVYIETPDISFNYKYVLLAYRDYNINPIVCSTFTSYKNNKITDDCILVKIREIDTNSDGIKDILKFEAQFYTDTPIKSFKLLLFFNFKLKQLFQMIMESIAVFNYILHDEVQEAKFSGDLTLEQKDLLNSQGSYKLNNRSIEMADYSLEELLMHNAKWKFAAKISNERITNQIGFSKEEKVVVHGELTYKGYLIYYQPSIWEELKWAWVQYLSCLLVFVYITKQILIFLFSNKYLNCYIMVPWKNK